jgi:hypothetical protein
MADWQKTQYRLGPKPDPLNDPMAGENLGFGIVPWLVICGFLLAVALLLGGLFL